MIAPAKRFLLSWLDRRGYQLVPDPYARRLARVLAARAIVTVIDGGANVGQFGQQLRLAGYTGRIVSIEPQTAAYARLQDAAMKDSGWHTINAALAAEPGEITINLSGNSVSSSPLAMHENHLVAAPESKYVGTEFVRAVTVDQVVADQRIEAETTMLKLDIQGYEKEALAGAARTLDRFAAVHLELSFAPNYEGGWLVNEVTDFMRERGFDLWMLDPLMFSDPKTGRLLATDGLYVPTHR